MSPNSPWYQNPMLLAVALSIAVAAVIVWRLGVTRRRARQATLMRELPRLVIPVRWEGEAAVPRRDERGPDEDDLQASNGHGAHSDEHILSQLGSASFIRRASQTASITPRSVPQRRVRTDVDDLESTSGSATVRFRRPTEEAMQLLPGRLEVLSGISEVSELRLVRAPGEPAQIILGRAPGPSPQHITLQSATVSRQHARLSFDGVCWTICNLSHTNPVVVNEDELGAGEQPLNDGDQIELGDVVLRFHAR